MSEIQAACLYAQLEEWKVIYNDRMVSWNYYHDRLIKLAKLKILDLPTIPVDCTHNAHMFFIKTINKSDRNKLLDYLNSRNIGAVFHYIPLHSAPAGLKLSRFNGEDKYTTIGSECIIRLPLWFGMTKGNLNTVVEGIYGYFRSIGRFND